MRLNLVPPSVIYSGKGDWAKQRGPFIKLPKKPSNHQLPHELVHVSQWWIITALSALVIFALASYGLVPIGAIALSVGVMGILTLLSSQFVWWSEVQAYRKSYEVSPDRLEDFAMMLYREYSQDKTLKECREALTK